jgi:polyhydroxyalkanoate synthesis regulator protein
MSQARILTKYPNRRLYDTREHTCMRREEAV